MKKSSKAALLSGLVFPGIGHIFLREYLRGFILVIVSLAALSGIVTTAYHQALPVVDQVLSGEVPMESGAIAQAVAESTSTAESRVENTTAAFLLVCWLAGILDSYRIGARQQVSEE